MLNEHMLLIELMIPLIIVFGMMNHHQRNGLKCKKNYFIEIQLTINSNQTNDN